MDSGGNPYGTTYADGANGKGSVFKLSRLNGTWILTESHDFTGGSDGGNPQSSLTFDTNGNLYGTATVGGTNDAGVRTALIVAERRGCTPRQHSMPRAIYMPHLAVLTLARLSN